jgi:hypothetical protein
MLRDEVSKPGFNGDLGGTHFQKVCDQATRLERLLRRSGDDSLSDSDRQIAESLLDDLNSAKAYAYEAVANVEMAARTAAEAASSDSSLLEEIGGDIETGAEEVGGLIEEGLGDLGGLR